MNAPEEKSLPVLGHCMQRFLGPLLKSCCLVFRRSKDRDGEGRGIKQFLVLACCGILDIAEYFLLPEGFHGHMTVDFNMKKVPPGLRFIRSLIALVDNKLRWTPSVGQEEG
jgi:hypothetical protein